MGVVKSNEGLAIRRPENQRVTYAVGTFGAGTFGRYIGSPHCELDEVTLGSLVAGPVKREEEFQFKLVLHQVYLIIIGYITQCNLLKLRAVNSCRLHSFDLPRRNPEQPRRRHGVDRPLPPPGDFVPEAMVVLVIGSALEAR